MSPPTANAIAYVRGLAEQGFWGFVTLKFENGHVVHLRREENLKPSELPTFLRQLPERSRRTEYEQPNEC